LGTEAVGKLKVLTTDEAGAYTPTAACAAVSAHEELNSELRLTVTVVVVPEWV